MPKNEYDVAIIGGGIAGLMTAAKLGRLGLKILLVEKEASLANGPSTRNSGWLHSGAYHAAMITDRARSIAVARHCIYGFEQIQRNYPEVIQSFGVSSHALIRDESRVEEVFSRWSEAGVACNSTNLHMMQLHHPNAKLDYAASFFEVRDASLDTRLLYRYILAEAKLFGAEIHLAAHISSIEERKIKLRLVDKSDVEIKAKLFIYAAGHYNKTIMHRLLNVDLPIRYWKSHMLIVPRLGEKCIFFVDPDEVAIIHHGEFSLINHTDDAFLVEEPNFKVEEKCVLQICEALRRLYPRWNGRIDKAVACIKSDFCISGDTKRSLDIDITEPVDGHIAILPGKLTEAPYLCDVLVRLVHSRIDNEFISMRPLDVLRSNSHMSADAAGSTA